MKLPRRRRRGIVPAFHQVFHRPRVFSASFSIFPDSFLHSCFFIVPAFSPPVFFRALVPACIESVFPSKKSAFFAGKLRRKNPFFPRKNPFFPRKSGLVGLLFLSAGVPAGAARLSPHHPFSPPVYPPDHPLILGRARFAQQTASDSAARLLLLSHHFKLSRIAKLPLDRPRIFLRRSFLHRLCSAA